MIEPGLRQRKTGLEQACLSPSTVIGVPACTVRSFNQNLVDAQLKRQSCLPDRRIRAHQMDSFLNTRSGISLITIITGHHMNLV